MLHKGFDLQYISQDLSTDYTSSYWFINVNEPVVQLILIITANSQATFTRQR